MQRYWRLLLVLFLLAASSSVASAGETPIPRTLAQDDYETGTEWTLRVGVGAGVKLLAEEWEGVDQQLLYGLQLDIGREGGVAPWPA